MRKNDSENIFLNGLALLGGGLLFAGLLRMFAKETIFYTCNRCNYDKLEFGKETCPNCKSNLEWPKQ